ncbi:MAG: cytochrome b/b6 domain-containing protein [Acidobacteriota bacterium]
MSSYVIRFSVWQRIEHACVGLLFLVLAVTGLSQEFFPMHWAEWMILDFRDAIMMTRYYLRLSDEQPRFDRFDYRQKWEYWGMLIGSLVMIGTGFMLYFPVETTRFLPGQLIPAALIAHGREGLLAFLVIIIWHFFNAHFSPEAFPFDSSIFTGKISRERMEKEHALEYERMLAESEEEPEAPPSEGTAPPG